MCRLMTRLAIALLTFIIGLALAMGLQSFRSVKTQKIERPVLVAAPPAQTLVHTEIASPPCVSEQESARPADFAINGGVLNGKALSLPQPAYPAIARTAHASGTVIVQIKVNECGNVIEARAVSGHPLLQAAAVQAAYQARFSPTRLSGQPVKVSGAVNYNFVLQD